MVSSFSRYFLAFLLSGTMLFSGCVLDDDDIVADINEAPVITSDGGGDTASLMAAEDQTSVTTVTYTDVDEPADSITFGLGGGSDDELFSISSAGVLVFNEAPSFTRPGDADSDGTYEVIVESNDGKGGVDTQTISVAVTATPLATGLRAMQSGGEDREYFLQLPADYGSEVVAVPLAEEDSRKPLLIALHGTNGSYKRWTDSEIGYDLVDAVGEDAIMVFPNALAQGDIGRQWSFSYDFEFFRDLLAELDSRGLEYNPNKIFVTGHSSGAAMVHEVGCRLGDVVRAIAPSAGTLISTECVGSVAVLMSQGRNDQLVKFDIATGGRRYWVLFNGWNLDASVPGEVDPCVDYSLLGSANTDYPVYWCEHGEGSIDDFSGHRWASFTGEAVWKFFSSLPEAAPTPNTPVADSVERAKIPSDTTITFTLKYPDNINTPLDGAISLFPAEYLDNPTFAIPSVFLNPVFAVGLVGPGETVTYENVPISFFVFSGDPVEFPSAWTLQFSVYVDGGTRPTPTPGVDHQIQIPFVFDSKSNPIVIEEVLTLVPASCFFNCAE